MSARTVAEVMTAPALVAVEDETIEVVSARMAARGVGSVVAAKTRSSVAGAPWAPGEEETGCPHAAAKGATATVENDRFSMERS